MSLPLLIYLAGVSTALQVILFLLGAAFLAIAGIFWIEKYENYLRLFASAAVCLFLFVFIPDSKTIYLMAGAKYSTEIAQSPEAKEIGNKILKVLNQKLDEIGSGKK